MGTRLGCAWIGGLWPGRACAAACCEHAARRHASAPRATNLMWLEPTIRAAVRLQGGPWEVEIRPERGGRVTSLRLVGQELLDQGIGVDDPSAAGFVAAGAWGCDEMVPIVEPTDALSDHGEAWRLPWRVMRAAGD